MKGFFSSRRFRHGSMAAAITAVVCAVVIVLNVIATTLTERYDLKLDLTPGRVFNITEETKDYLAALDKDVVIYVLSSEEAFTGYGEYYMQAVEVLRKYVRESERISLEFVDLNTNPAFVQQFPDIQPYTTSILVTCGDKVRDTTAEQLYEVESDYMGQGHVTASRAEQVLTSAVMAVTSENAVNVAVLSGHGEADIGYFTQLLGGNNYLIQSVDAVSGGLDPALFDLAILAAPQYDFTIDELRQLDDFLQNGGAYGKTLLYFAPAQQTDLPNLSAFLADWGVAVEGGFMYESDETRHIPQDQFTMRLDYAETNYSAEVQAAGLSAYASAGRPLSILFDNQSGITTTTLLEYAGSTGRLVSMQEVRESDGQATPFLVQSQYLAYDGAERRQSQVLTFGAVSFIDADRIYNAHYANSSYILTLIAELTGHEEGVQIQSKPLGNAILNISGLQAQLIGIVFTIILPLFVLVFGLVVWIRRRHL